MEQQPISGNSYLPLVIHLSVQKDSASAREWLLQWAHDYVAGDYGRWDDFAEFIFAADLRETSTLLGQLAENASEDTPNRPRQVLTIWEESDTLARAKALLLLALSYQHKGYEQGLYTTFERAEETIQTLYYSMSPDDRTAFQEFVEWTEHSVTMAYPQRMKIELLERIKNT